MSWIACVLLSATTGCKPTKRTYEMFCHYRSGWATSGELQRRLDSLAQRETG